ncbi:MAG: zinc ABC transporter substrate-binding protein [Parachlamydiales bacterium]|nr:zinc ABC transporter substrate-binding protein [Parachlamydiales bacterium]
MKRNYWLFLCLLLVAGCRTSLPPSKVRPLVVVTYSPYTYFVKRIAGPTLDVRSLIPSGENPLVFTPSMKEVKLAYDADLWFGLGKAFEKKLFSVIATHNPDLVTLNLCNNTESLEYDKEDFIWMSPKIVRTQIENIAEKLIEYFPENHSFYKENLRTFLADLEELDRDIRMTLDHIDVRSILISYPALAYFCRDYLLEQIAFNADHHSPSLSLVLKYAQEKHIAQALTQPHQNNQGIQSIAKILNIPVKMIDPFSENYLANMRYIAKTIANLP